MAALRATGVVLTSSFSHVGESGRNAVGNNVIPVEVALV